MFSGQPTPFTRHAALLCLAIAAGCQAAGSATRAGSPRRSAATDARGAATAGQATKEVDGARGDVEGSPSVPLRRSRDLQAPGTAAAARAVGAAPHTRLAGFQQYGRQTITTDDPFARQQELRLDRLLVEIQARNQTLQAMRAAWLAAAQRYPQERALDDPVFSSMVAPASLNSGIAGIPGNSAGYIVGGAQKLPWFGKRTLRGEAALAESRAARWEADDARLAIIEAAGIAYYDYYLMRQDLALNQQNRAKLRQFHDIAARKYEANLVPQQDMLQAEVELAELARRQIELERLERIAVARLNTLMHRPPDAYLPPPPARLDAPPVILSVAELRASALAGRPDLAALGARLRAEQSRLALAYKEFYPDVEVFGRYDNFWSQPSLRGQVGMQMNVPLYRDKRYAAAREAQWRLSQRRAEYEQRIDDINREVQTAFERFDEAQQTVGLYNDQILPAARKNVDSAFAAYETSGGDFLRLVAAQRQLIALQERYQESIADYHRRRVELERVTGQPLPATPPIEEIPPGSWR